MMPFVMKVILSFRRDLIKIDETDMIMTEESLTVGSVASNQVIDLLSSLSKSEILIFLKYAIFALKISYKLCMKIVISPHQCANTASISIDSCRAK